MLRLTMYSLLFFTACFPPQIDGPQVINATVNETVEVIITATHNFSNSFVFSVKYFPNVEIVANTSQSLVIRWRPMSTQKVSRHIFKLTTPPITYLYSEDGFLKGIRLTF